MKNIFTKIAIVILITMPSCKDMKLDIQDSKDRLDVLEGTTITTINEQITAINSSITDLQSMDETLDGYIKTLETTATALQKQINDANSEIAKVESELGEEISALEKSLLNELNSAKEAIQAELLAINKTLDDLKAADTALDKKIADLRTYVDTELASTKDWANATFSTLTQYEQTQTEISAIKASIEQINAEMAALEARLNSKIAVDIKTAIDALRAELNADHVVRIESAVNNVTTAYSVAISSAKSEITSAYTAAISSAISASESNLKTWVGEQLTQGYYDIATLDGILSALATCLDETDTDLQKQIDEQKEALHTAKKELTAAYKTAIEDAISENNGIINASIATAVQKLEDKVQARLTVIETNISNIQKELANISKDIALIFEQIAGITSAISDLKEVDRELDGYVKSLEEELVALREELEANSDADAETKRRIEEQITYMTTAISALQQRDSELHAEISNLESFVNVELQETADWAEATFATLEQYSVVQTEIAAIKTLINKTKEDIIEEYTAAIETAISNCETDMKTWVNTQLALGYYNIAAIDGKVSALEALISNGDSNLRNQINEQKEALQQAKADLTNEYKQYINQAIASGGIIDQAIATQVKKAQDNLQSQIDIINGRLDSLEDRVGKLEEDFVNRIQSLKYVPEYSDRVALMSDLTKSVLVDFLVTPMSQAALLVSEWKRDNTIIEAYLRYTKVPETRAASQSVPLSISSVSSSEDGILSVTLKENPSYPFSDDFLTGNNPAVIYLHISDGNTEILSDLVDVRIFEDEAASIVLSPYSDGKYQTANCYIVSAAGTYSFKAFKGNSQELAGTSHEDHPAGDISNAVVLWETFGTDAVPATGDLIKSVTYSDEEIKFQTAETFKEGNAVLAAKDVNGNILWSWHIWLTEPPQAQVYKNDAGTMMDRNLGATSAIKGDVGALGLLYQWGRKDPFLGSSSISDKIDAKSTISWPSAVSTGSSTGTVNYITSHPTTFVKASLSPYDWHYSSRDSTLWTTSDKTKSIYDPCPAGWRVPDGEDNGIWSKAGFADTTYDSTNEGMSFSISSPSTTWYPASGFRSNGGGDLRNVGYDGSYWSASLCSGSAYYLYFDLNGSIFPSFSHCRANGHSVRCLQE